MTDQDHQQATAREDLWRLLAACYYEPEADLAEERVFEAMAAAAGRLDPPLAHGARRLSEAFAAQDLQALLADYGRLFTGLQPLASPHGSAWLGGGKEPAPDLAAAVQGLYSEAGFEIDEAAGERPDHVAVELEFLHLLVSKENQARRLGDQVTIAGWQQLLQVFLRGHLQAWIGGFTQAVTAQAQTAFYRELAGLTARAVGLELARLPGR